MATNAGLPESLAEFLDVWCADLAGMVDAEDWRRIANDIHVLCEGGAAWPTRLHVQRLIEIAVGRVTEGAVQGELLELHAGGVDGALTRLGDPKLRPGAVHELGHFQPTIEVVRKITSATQLGWLSEAERVSILRRAMQLPDLPPPLPLPMALIPVPAGYPAPSGPTRGRHGPVRYRPDTLMPAMASYTPQRVDSRHRPVDASESRGGASGVSAPWTPMLRGPLNLLDGVRPGVPFNDIIDAFLRGRGWLSSRAGECGDLDHDVWIWPSSEAEPWWQPTIIDYDGARFRVRLASANGIAAPPTQYLTGEAQVRQEIGSIEEWTDGSYRR